MPTEWEIVTLCAETVSHPETVGALLNLEKTEEMNTLEIEIAMMRRLGVRQNLIVPNVSWGIANLHECDLLVLSKQNYATEIEIKISRADLLADSKKRHGHYHNHIARLFFAVPESLGNIALQSIPDRAGLYVVKNKRVKLARQCRRNPQAVRWTDKERLKLAHLGTMRILGLKSKIANS